MDKIWKLAIPSLLLFPSLLSAAVIHVPGDQPTIQAGIDAASDCDTVLVADGTYTGDGNRDLDFNGKAITVRSENGAENCIIDCEGSYSNPHRAFYFHNGEGENSIVEGFTMRNGYVSSNVAIREKGGGILCAAASPTILNNIIIENFSEWGGGGIACDGVSSPLIIGNTLIRNQGKTGGGAIRCDFSSAIISGNFIRENISGEDYAMYSEGHGGGIYSDFWSHPTITNNIIEGNSTREVPNHSNPRGGGIYCMGTAFIAGNTITGNWASSGGGGVHCSSSSTTAGSSIFGNIITGNASGMVGGGISSGDDSVTISNNIISGNTSLRGGGIYHSGSPYLVSTITNNLVENNSVMLQEDYGGRGGGIYCVGKIYLTNNSIIGNEATSWANDASGGGVYYISNSTITIVDSIFWNNKADRGSEICADIFSEEPATLNISYCDVYRGQAGVFLDPTFTVNWGAGIFDLDPLFAGGPLGNFYLGQVDAGQSADSPCVNSGSTDSTSLNLDTHTTRTDSLPDLHTVDIGFHYEIPGHASEPDTFILSGPQGVVNAPFISFKFTGWDDVDPLPDLKFSYCIGIREWSEFTRRREATIFNLSPGPHTFQVRAQDTDGHIDPIPAVRTFFLETWEPGEAWNFLVTGPGPGPLNPPLVRTPQAEWLAYGVTKYGVNVACGDLDSIGPDEVITGPGPGAVFGPNVRGWQADGSPLPGLTFLAYGTRKYGVNVAAGNIDDDGVDEIITGAGPGAVFGPHVRGWDYDGVSVSPVEGVNFIAYNTRRWGVNVTCSDIDGDGFDEIITGAGPGAVFGPHVRGWDYDGTGMTRSIPGVNFMAYGTPRFGVNVACGYLEADGRDEIITGTGPGPSFSAHVRGWNYDEEQISPMPGISYFAYTSRYGSVISAGDVEQDGLEEILTMPGPGPDLNAHVRAWDADNGTVIPVETVNFMAYDSWITHGGSISGGNLQEERFK